MWYTPDYVALLARRRGVRLERPADAAASRSRRATGADYLYLANVHPRDTRTARAILSIPWLSPRASPGVVWYRGKAGVGPAAVLLRSTRKRS